MLESAQEHVHVWFNIGTLPPASMNNVYYSEYVDWMVRYEQGLKNANAEIAIETTVHCAVKKDFLDDGTFTAPKVLGLLAQESQRTESNSIASLLNLISNLQELDEVVEFRLTGKDENLESVIRLFDLVALDIETHSDEQLE